MALRPNDLERDLSRGLKPAYLVSGDELLLVQEACDAIIAAARAKGFAERELIQVEPGFQWHELAQQSRTMSLFSEQRLLDVRVPAKRFDKDASEVLRAYLDAPPRDTILLLRTERLDSRQRSAAWFKAIDSVGATILVWPIEPRDLPGWLAQRCRAIGLKLEPDALEFLASSVEGNLLAAVQEIEKLKLQGLQEPVTLEALTRAVTDAAHYDAFDLVDAALGAQPQRVRHVMWVLAAEGVAALMVLGALTVQLRRLLSGDTRGLPQQRERVMRAARSRLGIHDLEALLQLALVVDQQAKGAARGDPWQTLERLALRLAGVDTLDWLDQRDAKRPSSGAR
jgi:DNA polymerase III subunit delta